MAVEEVQDDRRTNETLRANSATESGGYQVSGKAWQTELLGGHELADVDLGTVRYSIGPLALGTNLDVWDEPRRGAKVLNINWASDGAIEVVSFRRGDWEQILLDRAKRMFN